MTVPSNLVLVGVAKQTGRGAAAATPAYGFGVSGGNVAGVELDQEKVALTYSTRVRGASYRNKATPGADMQTLAFPRGVGLLLYGALGTVVTTGAGAPYSHAISDAADLPYLTLWGQMGSHYYRLVDCKVDTLSLEWDENAPIEVGLTVVGCDIEPLAAPFVPTTIETEVGGFFRPLGGVFTIDGAAAEITAGSIELANNLTAVPKAGQVNPRDVSPGELEASCSLTVVPDNLNLWRRVVFGSDVATDISNDPYYGDFDCTFTIDANTSLAIATSRVEFTADFPDADPGGEPAEIELEGNILRPASGAAITATLRNAVAAY